jgi:two-component system nitrate/nitrite response regulator NarL
LIRILVVEDFEPFRQFIRSTLRKSPELQLVGVLSDGRAAVENAEQLRPDLILLDIGLPTMSGIEAARRIRKLVPESKIIFVSQQSAPEIVEEALSLGAQGYVLKARISTDLLAAVETALDGGQFVSKGLISLIPA